jgi:uncharacterized membrane protein YcjF (UPF0283 family)
MFWYILGIISLVLLIAGILIYNLWYWHDELGFGMAVVGGVILLFAVILVPYVAISDNQSVKVFEQQKEYIENHVSKNDVEDAAITTKKIELNEWLYNAQYGKEHYNIFSLYPDEIIDLTPIK